MSLKEKRRIKELESELAECKDSKITYNKNVTHTIEMPKVVAGGGGGGGIPSVNKNGKRVLFAIFYTNLLWVVILFTIWAIF